VSNAHGGGGNLAWVGEADQRSGGHGKAFAFSMNLHASSREKVRERCLRPRAGLANMPGGIEE